MLDAERVRDELNMRGGCAWLADRLGVDVRRVRGDKLTVRCWHPESHSNGDRNPSMEIGPGGWTCYGCGAKGDAFGLVLDREGGTFPDAVRRVAELLGLEIDGRSPARRRRTPARPTARPEPPPPEPEPEVLALMRDVWRLVAPVEPTDELAEHLLGRGLNPWTAHELGVRDWRPALLAVVDLLRSTPEVVKLAAGFYQRGDDAVRAWWPLAALARRQGGAGYFLPVFMPEHPDAPLTFRWRTFDRSARLKVASMYGAPPLAFGLAHPPCWAEPDGPLTARTADARWLTPGAGAGVVVVVEGEPDWLAACDVLGPSAGVVALTAVARGWPAAWTPHLLSAGRVVVMLHDTDAARRAVDDVGGALLTAFGRDGAARRLVRLLVPEGDDLADRAQRGELAAWLYDVAADCTTIQGALVPYVRPAVERAAGAA